MTQFNHSVFSQIVSAPRSNNRQILPNSWLKQRNSVSVHLRESEEARLEENTFGQGLRIRMDRSLEDDKFEGDCTGAQLILLLRLNTVHFLLAILALHLRGWVSQNFAIAHLDQLNLVFT